METEFNNILDKDEEIVKIYKPNKSKLYVSWFLGSFLTTLFFAAFLSLTIIIPDEAGVAPSPLFLLIPFGVQVLVVAIALILAHLYYKNLYFAYSNKRVIIRTGIFGIDYKSLDLNMIGAINVNVSLLDKIMRKNTGSISFGSPASPMITSSNGTGLNYIFSHIENPYQVYREIKDTIDTKKKENN